METLNLDAELPSPTAAWRLLDAGSLVASDSQGSPAPRTVGDLVAYLQRGPGRVPVLGVDVTPNAVAVQYAEGCIVQQLTYLTGADT